MSGAASGSPTKSSRGAAVVEQVLVSCSALWAFSAATSSTPRVPDSVDGRAGDDDDRLPAAQGPRDGGRHGGRAEHGDGVDAGGEVADGAGEVGLAVGEHQRDALAELGGSGLEAHQQLGVVGTGELGQHQPVGLVVPHGEAAGGAERHVVEGVDGVEHLLRVASETTVAPWRTRETVAIETPARSATE